MHRHQAHHADSPHPPLHPLHHGHRHPLRLLLSHQAAPGGLGTRGAMLVQTKTITLSEIRYKISF